MTTRRTFLSIVPAAGAALAASRVAAQSAPMVDEKDPQAVALGYVADAKRVDKAKFPKYSPSQHCAICQFYQGPAAASDGAVHHLRRQARRRCGLVQRLRGETEG